MEKESAIGKINKVGKIGTVIITILKVLLIIGMVVTVVGSVLLYIIPDDIFTADMTMNMDMKIDVSSLVSKGDKTETLEEQNVGEQLKEEFAKDPETNGTKDNMIIEVLDCDGNTILLRGIQGVMKISLHRCAFGVAALLIYLVASFVSVMFAGRLTKALRDCRTPFEETVIKALKCFAYSLIPWAFISCIVDNIGNRIWSMSYMPQFSFSVNVSIILIVLVVLGIAYVFQYGAVLQQESDETL